MREPLVEAHPEVPGYRAGLGETYLRLGQVRCDMKNLAGAAAAWKRALRALRWDQVPVRRAHVLPGLLPRRPGGTRGPAGLGSVAAEGADQAEKAMAVLRQAVTMGYRNPDAYRTESALDPLRNRPDFRALMMDLVFPTKPLRRSASGRPMTRRCRSNREVLVLAQIRGFVQESGRADSDKSVRELIGVTPSAYSLCPLFCATLGNGMNSVLRAGRSFGDRELREVFGRLLFQRVLAAVAAEEDHPAGDDDAGGRAHGAQRLVRHGAELLSFGQGAILGREPFKRGRAHAGRGGSRGRPDWALAPSGTEVAGREAGVQARLGIEQKCTGGRDPLAGLDAPDDRVVVAATGTQDHLDTVEHPGHSLDEHDLAGAGVDNGRPRDGQDLVRRAIGDDAGLEGHPATRATNRSGMIGRDVRVHRAPPSQPLVIGQWPRHPDVTVDRATARLGSEGVGMVGAGVNLAGLARRQGRWIGW